MRLQTAAVPIAVVTVYGAIDCLHGGSSLIATVPGGTREAFFASLAATSGALLGFAITGLTILLTLGGDSRMKWLMKQKRFRVEARFLFTSAIAALGFATGVFLLLIIVATDEASFWAPWGYLALATAALVAERVTRLVFFFHDLMGVALKDADKKPIANPAFEEPLDD
jgi:hypothetical protein